MNIAVKHSAITNTIFSKNKLIWAIICSILLHVLFAVVIPNIKIEPIKKPEPIEIRLVNKPEPPPVIKAAPIQPQPEPAKPEKIPPKLKTKAIVKPAPLKNEPAPYEPVATTHVEVMAVTPKADVMPTPALVPEPTKPVTPSQAEITVARDGYSNILWGAISKYKQYPNIARMRGWQGDVVLELLLDGNGKLKSKKVLKGSGYDILDKQALDMVEKAAPFPAPPETLRGSSFTITVPIPFKLEQQ